MERAGNFLEKRLFWFIMLIVAILFVGIFYFFLQATTLEKNNSVALRKLLDLQEKDHRHFVNFCLKDRLVINCKSLNTKDGHCSEKLYKTIDDICLELEKDGLTLADNLMIDLRAYEECTPEIIKQTGCAPYFVRTSKTISGYGTGLIYLPKSYFNKPYLKSILVHEIRHGINSTLPFRMARISDEFLAIYSQTKFDPNIGHRTCYGSFWNNPVLATNGGDYVFPIESGNIPMEFLSSCRYGQMETVARVLHKKFPGLYKKMNLALNQLPQERLDSKRLLQMVLRLNLKAGRLIASYYVFKQSDHKPHIAIIERRGQYCFFVYRIVNENEEDYYKDRIGIFASVHSGVRQKGFSWSGTANFTCIMKTNNASGDKIKVIANFGEQSLQKEFIIP